MRGSPPSGGFYVYLIGIIPAHAGLTSNAWASARRRRDHPRACGAHMRQSLIIVNIQGSSPRMRGSPVCRLFSCSRPGIIPAHAGLTVSLFSSIFPAGDHPRACGAHRKLTTSSQDLAGSSPRMRGSRNQTVGQYPWVGIIPAHAGLTWRAAGESED